jgi:23S rRNA pseudouridine1911/1915/1917 synthase
MNKSFVKKINLVNNITKVERLDKILAQIIPEELGISRSRIQELMSVGAVVDSRGNYLKDPSAKSYVGQEVSIFLSEAEQSEIGSENIKLNIIYEDQDLLVVNKPAGMVVHPAPGSYSGTLVNALLYHCGESLSGIGGIKRPGIVHRIDKDTSGLLVVAKTNAAHIGLSKQFFEHTIERKYLAFVYGCPSRLDKNLNKLTGIVLQDNNQIKISNKISRHKNDRKKMAVHDELGRHAVTTISVKKTFGFKKSPVASLLECVLETGRTHQIRVHLNYLGHSIIGDQTYKSRKRTKISSSKRINDCVNDFSRQALHAAVLGFIHPINKEHLCFRADIPDDIQELLKNLEEINSVE